MSTLYITEFDQLTITDNGVPPFGKANVNTKFQSPAFATASNSFAITTKFVRVSADATCTLSYTAPGGSPVNIAYLGTNTRGEYFGVDGGGTITATAAS